MVALTSDKISASELIAVMSCVSMAAMAPIARQIFKSPQIDEQNTATKKLLSLACGLLQLAGFIVVIVLADVSSCHASLMVMTLNNERQRDENKLLK